ncbi:MAG: DUF1722 domain-containing protein [Sulfurospirillaceae bacterium]|nr:DUF1722 domain-containing protein [Sulfurospirillaceae bacterium]MDD3462842.1 DUF1722 domain-containing protein [Sulfurospirillaceae bacterium]
MKIAVSACLLGEKVRFDGGHKQDAFIMKQLSHYASFVPFCPEAKAFGIPRPSIRLVKEKCLEVISNKDGRSLLTPLEVAVSNELTMLEKHSLTGIILKSKSPSCGLGSAKVYLPNGQSIGKGNGVMAQKLQDVYPYLPIEEEGRLQDPWLRENFVMQLFAYDRWMKLLETPVTMHTLISFHTASKFLLQAKNEQNYRELGKIVANHESRDITTCLSEYGTIYLKTIAIKSSIKKTRNVLEHMAGFLKKVLHVNEKEMLHQLIQEYAEGIIPLITPMSILLMLAKKYDITYLLEQYFISPYPKELALRSSIQNGRLDI